MQTRHVRAFLAVVETGSIRTASRRLGLSQPALTKTLQELEAFLGVPLILRSSHGSIPTEFGRAFFARAKMADEELRRAKEEIDQMLGGQGGTVSVGLSPVASLLMASDALSRFWRTHPTAKVRVIDGLFEHLLVGVRQGRFDFSIGGLPPTQFSGDVEAEPLFKNQIVPWVRKGHPLAQVRSLADLKNADWLLTNDEPAFINLITQHFEDLGLPPPNVTLTCESFPTILELIPNTDLVAALPRKLLTHELIAGRMSVIPVSEPPPTTTVALVKRVNVPLTPLAERLAGHFRRIARRLENFDLQNSGPAKAHR